MKALCISNRLPGIFFFKEHKSTAHSGLRYAADSGNATTAPSKAAMQELLVTFDAFAPSHTAAARALWETSDGVGLSSADEPEALIRFLQRNPGLSFVALWDAQVVGTVLCGHDGRRGLIHHLVVAQSFQRRGLGRQLLQRSLVSLTAEGIQKAHLLVFRSNEPGLAFWRAVGAEERTSLALFSLSAGMPPDHLPQQA